MGASQQEAIHHGNNGDPGTDRQEGNRRDMSTGFHQPPTVQTPPQPPPLMSRQQERQSNFHLSRLERLNPTNPLRVAMSRNAAAAGAARPTPPRPVPVSQASPPPRPVPVSQASPPPRPVPISQAPPPPRPVPVSQPPPSQAPVPIRQPAPPSPSSSRAIPIARPPPTLSQPPVPPGASPFTPHQPTVISLNSRVYTNRFSLFIFLIHAICSIGLVGFLIVKGTQGFIAGGHTKRKEMRFLRHFLPQVEAASLLSITLAFLWQKAIRVWPKFMVHFILWSSFSMSLSAAILLICFQTPSTNGVGVLLLFFSVGNGLYACWVTQRTAFCTKILIKSLEPVAKFHDLNWPTYWMLGVGYLWISLWILAVIGALNFYFPALVVILLSLSLAWIAEVMRNVANITISRVIALYYLRGMQVNTRFCFQRAMTRNLGSACLGSLFVPTIEALRIVARGLNLLEGEDELMFCCAHCCLKVMGSIFRYGNGWAYVQIASYGKSFVKASQDTWALFERLEDMEMIVDSDITTSLCFLTGVCSGSICVIMVAAWTFKVHHGFTATISLLAFFVGYLMTRIAMALPHACVSCYYVCYAENPQNRLFDTTIQDRINLIRAGRDVVVPTPRVPHRLT